MPDAGNPNCRLFYWPTLDISFNDVAYSLLGDSVFRTLSNIRGQRLLPSDLVADMRKLPQFAEPSQGMSNFIYLCDDIDQAAVVEILVVSSVCTEQDVIPGANYLGRTKGMTNVLMTIRCRWSRRIDTYP